MQLPPACQKSRARLCGQGEGSREKRGNWLSFHRFPEKGCKSSKHLCMRLKYSQMVHLLKGETIKKNPTNYLVSIGTHLQSADKSSHESKKQKMPPHLIPTFPTYPFCIDICPVLYAISAYPNSLDTQPIFQHFYFLLNSNINIFFKKIIFLLL